MQIDSDFTVLGRAPVALHFWDVPEPLPAPEGRTTAPDPRDLGAPPDLVAKAAAVVAVYDPDARRSLDDVLARYDALAAGAPKRLRVLLGNARTERPVGDVCEFADAVDARAGNGPPRSESFPQVPFRATHSARSPLSLSSVHDRPDVSGTEISLGAPEIRRRLPGIFCFPRRSTRPRATAACARRF